MKIGPIQQMWIDRLKKYPNKQDEGRLGFRFSDGEYTACCLGELLLCKYRYHHKKLPVGEIFDGEIDKSGGELFSSFKKLGLYTADGLIVKEDGTPSVDTLAELNDNNWTWPMIAKFIEQYPEKVFYKSV